MVNALTGHPAQRVAAGLALTALLSAIPLLPLPPVLAVTGALFVFKVGYAFAVDHRADVRSTR